MVKFYNQKLILGTISTIVFVLSFLSFSRVYAEIQPIDPTDRSYSYPLIDFYFKVNKDSTVNVLEKETFLFNGEYHLGWRSLSLLKLDRISDIEVIDTATDTPLKYSYTRLDKTDPKSWGSYTVYSQNNSKNIEWYFDQRNTSHTWTLKYKLHGAIGFYKDHDELYYNLLTDFTVPIDQILATVSFPFELNDSNSYVIYRTNKSNPSYTKIINNNTFSYIINQVGANEKVSISPGWAKGFIDKNAYWKDFIESYWGIVWALIMIILSGFISLIYWYFAEKYPLSKMVVVSQFGPPQNLPPAMAEIIMKESITDKAFPATIIDLACRGYLTITEENSPFWSKVIGGNKNYIKWIFMLPLITFIITVEMGPAPAAGSLCSSSNISVITRAIRGAEAIAPKVAKPTAIAKGEEWNHKNTTG